MSVSVSALVLALDVAAFTCAAVYLLVWLPKRSRCGGLPGPPGPQGYPLVGNIFDKPGVPEWERARQWGAQHGLSTVCRHTLGAPYAYPHTQGDIILVRSLGKPYIIVNSYEAAVELFEKRGHNYSSRPQNTLIELEGWNLLPSQMAYGDEHRKSRQLLHRFFGRPAVSDFCELQTHVAHRLLLGLLKEPDEFRYLTRRSAGESIMMAAYGYKVAEKNDPYIDLAEKGIQTLSDAKRMALVNIFPSLRYLPEWLPGTSFHKTIRDGYDTVHTLLFDPYEKTKKEITVSALNTFILAMVLFPDAQRRGKEELDRVIGKDALPTMQDRPNLTYINAICNEVLRWEPVSPLGVAHCPTEDDVYNGYFIPAGITMYANIWAMQRNPSEYPEPDKFIPERWLPFDGEKTPLDVHKTQFGFGRR
ncbi:hypothetical protein EW145_g8131, partial [Phellinidium pouzarii]